MTRYAVLMAGRHRDARRGESRSSMQALGDWRTSWLTP